MQCRAPQLPQLQLKQALVILKDTEVSLGSVHVVLTLQTCILQELWSYDGIRSDVKGFHRQPGVPGKSLSQG